MPHRDIPLGANLLADFDSQALCLEDALRSGDEGAMAHALEAVTRSRGLDQLATEAGVTRSFLMKLLDRAAAGETTDLAGLVSRLVARWSAGRRTVEAKTEKDRPNMIRTSRTIRCS